MGEGGWLARLRDTLEGRRVVPPDPPGKVAHAPADEAPAVIPVSPPDHAGAWSCFITYVNARGEESARTITIRRIYGHFGRPETLHARCHLRNDWRRFTISSITGMACAVTGEELDPLENCLALHRSGALKIEDVVLTRMLRMLVFMARCDGEFHSLERAELEDILGRYFRFFGGNDAAYECAIREAPRLAPAAEDLIRDLRWLSRAPRRQELARFAINGAAAMIDADHRHHEAEVAWALEVSNVLHRIAGRG